MSFQKNLALTCSILYVFLALCQSLEITNDPIPRKSLYGRTDGLTNRPYFIGPFSLLLQVQFILINIAVQNRSIVFYFNSGTMFLEANSFLFGIFCLDI